MEVGFVLLAERLSAGKVHERRIMRDVGKRWQWAEWRTPWPGSGASRFGVGEAGTVISEPVLVPPNADRDARFQVQFLQDMLHVLLNGAGTASQNLSYLRVAFPCCDPFHHLKLALR
jgi:hypothetical protein